MVFTNAIFLWNAVDLKAHVREIHLTVRKTKVPDHDTMGSTGEKYVVVLQAYDLEVIFRQDYAAAAVEKTLAADHLAGTARAFEIRPDAGVVSATNPKYTGTAFIEEYGPINGAFGEVLGARATFTPSIAGITRAEA